MKRLNATGLLLVVGLALAGCKQAPTVTQAGEINLAGCHVPAGITQEEAERVECGTPEVTDSPEAFANLVRSEAMPESAAVSASALAFDAATWMAATSDAEVINTAISARAAQDGGSEYADARKLVKGDLDGDGAADVAVLYSLEGAGGGNDSVGYLAAFVRTGGQLKLADTATLSGSAQSLSLKDSTAHLKLLSLGPDDSACCPSIEDDVVYVLHGNKWLQLQAQP
jgi:hypothetical protein